jgi:hypothetical protein
MERLCKGRQPKPDWRLPMNDFNQSARGLTGQLACMHSEFSVLEDGVSNETARAVTARRVRGPDLKTQSLADPETTSSEECIQDLVGPRRFFNDGTHRLSVECG